MQKAIISLALMATTILLNAKMPAILSQAYSPEMTQWVDSVFNKLTPEERIGQIINKMFEADDIEAAKAAVDEAVAKYHFGWAYCSIGPAQHHAIIANYANSVSRVPVAMTLDGEWGLAMRMPDTPRFPKNMMLGAIQDEELLYEFGKEMARECHEVGVNVNFAPVVDVNSNPLNPIIGLRSYGENPDNVAAKAILYAKGLESGRVLSCAKHFPGHGDTDTDSHKTLPTVNRSYEQIMASDVPPFAAYINQGLGAVMVAHLDIPALNTAGRPTSQTRSVAHGLLRDSLGFEGITFTDGLKMLGAHPNDEPNGLVSLLAGADVLINPHRLEQSFAELVMAYNNRSDVHAMIDAACKKTLAYKYALGLNSYKPVNIDGMMERINSPYALDLCRRMYEAAITVVKNDNDVLPLDADDCMTVALGDADNIAKIAGGNDNAGNIVAAVFDVNDEVRRALSLLLDGAKGKKVTIVAFTIPYKLADIADLVARCDACVVAYEAVESAQFAAMKVISGNAPALGRMSVSVEGVAKVGEGLSFK